MTNDIRSRSSLLEFTELLFSKFDPFMIDRAKFLFAVSQSIIQSTKSVTHKKLKKSRSKLNFFWYVSKNCRSCVLPPLLAVPSAVRIWPVISVTTLWKVKVMLSFFCLIVSLVIQSSNISIRNFASNRRTYNNKLWKLFKMFTFMWVRVGAGVVFSCH